MLSSCKQLCEYISNVGVGFGICRDICRVGFIRIQGLAILNSDKFYSEPADEAQKLTARGICPNGDGATLKVMLVWFMPADHEVVKDGHLEFCKPGDFVRFVGSVWRIEKDTLTVCITDANVVWKNVLSISNAFR